MLSPKLSKILVEKNVPHEGDFYYDRQGRLIKSSMGSSMYESGGLGTSDLVNYDPAYPDIALFKYASFVWSKPGTGITEYSEQGTSGFVITPRCTTCGKQFTQKQIDKIRFGHKNCPKAESDFKYHTHTLADLFSSGASEQEIEDYVITSLEGK